MYLQRISVPLKNIANVSKRNGNALQCIFNALKMHYNEKNASTLFSLSLLFPNRVTFDIFGKNFLTGFARAFASIL